MWQEIKSGWMNIPNELHKNMGQIIGFRKQDLRAISRLIIGGLIFTGIFYLESKNHILLKNDVSGVVVICGYALALALVLFILISALIDIRIHRQQTIEFLDLWSVERLALDTNREGTQNGPEGNKFTRISIFNPRGTYPLPGMLFGRARRILAPNYRNKKGKNYRYYSASPMRRRPRRSRVGSRSTELESLVSEQLHRQNTNPTRILDSEHIRTALINRKQCETQNGYAFKADKAVHKFPSAIKRTLIKVYYKENVCNLQR